MKKTARAELGEIIEFTISPRLKSALKGAGVGAAIGIPLATGVVLLNPNPRVQKEIRDPRLYSNLRGMATLEGADKRIAAHKRFRKPYGRDSVISAAKEGFLRENTALSAREELDLILFRSPTLGELEKHEKKSSTAKNLAIAGGVTAGVGGLGYLAYKGGKAFGTAKEEAQKGSRAVRTILEDKLSPAIEEMKKVAIRGQEATAIPAFFGRTFQPIIESKFVKAIPSHLEPIANPIAHGKKTASAFREGSQGETSGVGAKIGRKLGRGYGHLSRTVKGAIKNIGAISSRKMPIHPMFSAREELNLILFADPRPRNSLGMFSGGGMEGMPNPNAMKIVYDPRRLQAGMPKEGGLMQIGRPIRKIMRR